MLGDSSTERIVGGKTQGKECVIVTLIAEFQGVASKDELAGLIVEDLVVDSVLVRSIVASGTSKSSQAEASVIITCIQRDDMSHFLYCSQIYVC